RTRGVPLSIEPVACQRMADRREMHANLMRPAGFEKDVEQRAVQARLDRIHMRHRALALVAHGELDGADARERRVDRLPLCEPAFAQREVTLANPLRLELPREPGVDVGTLRE